MQLDDMIGMSRDELRRLRETYRRQASSLLKVQCDDETEAEDALALFLANVAILKRVERALSLTRKVAR